MNALDLTKDSIPEETENNTLSDSSEVLAIDTEEITENPSHGDKGYFSLSKTELVEKLRDTIKNAEKDVKEEVAHIKQVFYKKLKVERDEQRAAFEKEDADSENKVFVAETDAYETELKALLNEYREKKAHQIAQTEAQKENNLQAKLAIIEEIKTLTESPENVGNAYPRFRELQQTWKEIGQISTARFAEVMKTYNLYVEKFYDLVKMNNELRDYDFKKNLEAKNALCEQAELLDKEADVLVAFQKLQKIHDEWREIGPVEKELREEIWNRLKAASSIINKNHQIHFDQIKEHEENNLLAKTALCEKMEAIDYALLVNYKEWDDKTHEVIHVQEEWKKIGFAPRKMNVKIYDRYRTACDKFFSEKAGFYKKAKDESTKNFERRKELATQAQALKDSTDWKDTTDKLVAMQKEWKTIGPAPKKYSEIVWQEFINACNYFFEQKEKAFSSQKSEENENLQLKKELIENIKLFQKSDNNSESISALKNLAAKWNEIGHVPFKEKDKLYKEYRSALDAQFDLLHVDKTNRQLDSFKHNVENLLGKDKNKLFREREKLIRELDTLSAEIKTYENNIGFFSSSKKGNSLITEMEQKIEKLKEEKVLLAKKIELIENTL